MSQAKISHFDQAAATWDDNPMRIALMKAVGEAILREARPTKNMDVLDYGCGTGLVGLYLLPSRPLRHRGRQLGRNAGRAAQEDQGRRF